MRIGNLQVITPRKLQQAKYKFSCIFANQIVFNKGNKSYWFNLINPKKPIGIGWSVDSKKILTGLNIELKLENIIKVGDK